MVELKGGLRRRTWVKIAASVVVAAVLMSLGSGGASGQAVDDDAVVQGKVDAGFDGYFVPGRPVPIRVTLSATELWSGEVAVSFGNGTGEHVQVEITGGTSEEHWLLLDAPPSTDPVVTVSARRDGRSTTSSVGRDRLLADTDTQLVGTLAGLGGLELDDIETVVGGQDIVLVRLEPALLDLGPEALAALDSVAATHDDLTSLSDSHRDALLGWLTLGGTLYVDGPTGPLPGWPDALQPTSPQVRAGAATVVATDGALTRGEWSAVVIPAPNRSVIEDDLVGQTIAFSDAMSELWGADLGRDLPELSGLLWILALYALLVGPLAYLALRRHVMARWVVIPSLAVLATVAIVAQGGGKGTDAAASVVDVIETGPGSAMATSRILMASDQGGRHVDAPAGWTAQFGEDEMFGWGFGSGLPVTQRRTLDGVEIDVPAAAGGVGVLSAQGPVTFSGALEVSATAVADGTVTGVVRNTTDVSLHDVAVFAGRVASTSVGTLEPGGTAEFELSGTTQYRFGADPFGEVWQNAGAVQVGGAMPMIGGVTTMECDANGNCFESVVSGPGCFGDACSDVVPRAGSLGSALRSRGVNAMPPGMVTAVGWATDLDPVLDLGRDVTISETRTAVVGRTVAQAGGDRMADAAAVRQLVSADMTDDGMLELLYRFDLPADVGGRPVDPARLRIDLPNIFLRVELLSPSGPIVIREPEPGVFVAPPGREEVVVPIDAIVGNHVFIRCALQPVAPPGGRELVIFEVAS